MICDNPEDQPPKEREEMKGKISPLCQLHPPVKVSSAQGPDLAGLEVVMRMTAYLIHYEVRSHQAKVHIIRAWRSGNRRFKNWRGKKGAVSPILGRHWPSWRKVYQGSQGREGYIKGGRNWRLVGSWSCKKETTPYHLT